MDRILVVDDNRLARTMAVDVLSENGYKVTEADCAQAARERMAEQSHNVVLLDVVLPDTNGIDLLKEFVERYPSTRVVIITAHSSLELAVRAIERGAYDYVSKPLRGEELLVTVRKALDNFWLSHQRDMLIETQTRRIDRLEMFEGISRIISATLDVEHLVDLSMRIVRDLIPADLYRFLLAGTQETSAASYTFRRTSDGLEVSTDETGLETALNTLSGWPRLPDDGGEQAEPRALVVPMRKQGRMLGALQVLNFGDRSLGSEARETLGILGSHLATALQNAMLTEELRSSKAQIESYSRDLERMVGERTRELEDANQNLRRINTQLKQAHKQLIQGEKMASLGQLAAGVAHEINNPLAFITSNLHTLKEYLEGFREVVQAVESSGRPERGLLDQVRAEFADAEEILEDCREGTRRVEKIVVSLKDFSAADREIPLETDLNAEVEKSLKLVWNELKYKAAVDLDLGEIPRLRCYPNQLGQVVVNLLINASQALDGEGRIGVATRSEGDEVIIEVSDTGTGISDEILERIFEPFFTTKEVGQGTGLGLSVSYGIVQRHNGRIEVLTREGGGTTFQVRLPATGVVVRRGEQVERGEAPGASPLPR